MINNCKKRFYLFAVIFSYLLLFSPFQLFSQGKTSWVDAGDNAFSKANYFGALHCYRKANKFDPFDQIILFKVAESARLSRNYLIATNYYKKIYDLEPELFPLAGYYYGICLKQSGRYNEAYSHLRRFSNRKEELHLPDSLVNLAKREAGFCKLLPEISSFFAPDIQFLDSVSSEYSEFNPFIIDEECLYIIHSPDSLTNEFSYRLSLFPAKNQKLNKLVSELNKFAEVNSFCFNSSMDLLLFSGKRSNENEFSIYYQKLTGNIWKSPVRFISPVNQLGSSSIHPYITNTGFLYFSSNRAGGRGGYDIYRCSLMDSCIISDYINMGEQINTSGNELSPFFFERDSDFYFSSDSHPGFGGYDIFKISYDTIARGPVLNCGRNLNSGADDLFLKFFLKERKGLFVSNRPIDEDNVETCCNKLFYFDIPFNQNDSLLFVRKEDESKNRLHNLISEANSLFPIDLYFENDQPDPKTFDSLTQFSYSELFNSYLSKKEDIKTEFGKGLNIVKQEKAWDELDEFFEKKVIFGNNLLEDFCFILSQIVAEGKTVRVYMYGFSSPLNSNVYNLMLSKRRISSVYNYFILNENLKGFAKSTISIVQSGMGEIQFPGLSDDLMDIRNSVYSPTASLARKVSILKIEIDE